jgi:hypothetical protein
MIVYRFDCGHNATPREVLKKAILEGGPFDKHMTLCELIEDAEFTDGWYKLDPALTYAPLAGGRLAVYRWTKLDNDW